MNESTPSDESRTAPSSSAPPRGAASNASVGAPLKLAVIGAGPVGLALALHAATALPDAEITLFDARPSTKDVSGDPRTLALSLGSVQVLQRLGAWRPENAQPIAEVHVSQDAPSLLDAVSTRFGEPALVILSLIHI